MDFLEQLLLIVSGFFTVRFFMRWYRFTLSDNQIRRNTFVRTVFCLMPLFSFVTILYTLTTLASFDVVDASVYILFYLLIGFVWLYFGLFLMFYFFDLSWIDDALNMNNPAAAISVAAGSLGVTLIYAGANIGDGPGWWCVFFAGGLGLAAWIVLGILVNSTAKIFRRITIGRDIFCAVRTSAFLLSSGIILGRASAGDWTSFSETVIEFGDGWPVILLTAAFILTERLFLIMEKQERQSSMSVKWFFSLLLGAVYITAAIYVVKILPPLPVNPIY